MSFLSTSINSSAQITFQKMYGGASDDIVNKVTLAHDGGYVFAGQTFSYGLGPGKMYMVKTDIYGNINWTKTFNGPLNNDNAFTIIQTSDSGYFLAGATQTIFNAVKIFVVKTDMNGNMLWSKTISDSLSTYDEISSVVETVNGDFVLLGHNASDVYVVKIDGTGNLIWAKSYGGASFDSGKSLITCSNGGYIIAGFTNTFGTGNSDAYVLRINDLGNLLWSKTFGGFQDDIFNSVRQTISGDFIFAGETSSFGSGANEVLLIKTDSAGNELWSKCYGGVLSETGWDLLLTDNNGVIIFGSTTSFGWGTGDLFLIKTDSDGNLLWSRAIGGSDEEDSQGYSNVLHTSDSGFVFIGNTYSFGSGFSDCYLVKTDSLGNSGCNTLTASTLETTFNAINTNPSTIVNSPVTLINSFSDSTGSVGVVITECIVDHTDDFERFNNVRPELLTVFPNPFSESCFISFQLFQSQYLSVKIFDISGRLVSVIAEKVFEKGKNELILDSKNLIAGVYFLRIEAKEYSIIEKIEVFK